jgi:hypothetical protein
MLWIRSRVEFSMEDSEDRRSRRTAREFVLGLLSPAERKNCWWPVELAGHDNPRAMQRPLRTAVWDVDAVRRRADEWDGLADITASADGIEAAVDRLLSGGLVGLISKYDGVDLPGDACRVLVIHGLPEAYGGIDRREACRVP